VVEGYNDADVVIKGRYEKFDWFHVDSKKKHARNKSMRKSSNQNKFDHIAINEQANLSIV
jgi:hypothetical protein